MKLSITVHQHTYHRNGISGLGFHALAFSWTEDGKSRSAVATVDAQDVHHRQNDTPHDPATRVLVIGPAGGVNLSETLRGDYFHEDLCDWLLQRMVVAQAE